MHCSFIPVARASVPPSGTEKVLKTSTKLERHLNHDHTFNSRIYHKSKRKTRKTKTLQARRNKVWHLILKRFHLQQTFTEHLFKNDENLKLKLFSIKFHQKTKQQQEEKKPSKGLDTERRLVRLGPGTQASKASFRHALFFIELTATTYQHPDHSSLKDKK